VHRRLYNLTDKKCIRVSAERSVLRRSSIARQHAAVVSHVAGSVPRERLVDLALDALLQPSRSTPVTNRAAAFWVD